MKLSPAVYESLEVNKQLAVMDAERQRRREEQSEESVKVSEQIARAARIAKRQSVERYINKDGVFYNTAWVKVGPSEDSNAVVQAQLHRVDNVENWILRSEGLKIGIPIGRSLACVQLYLRLASSNGQVAASTYNYPVLFDNHPGEDRPCIWLQEGQGNTPTSSTPVTSDSPAWQEIDGILQAFEKSPFTGRAAS